MSIKITNTTKEEQVITANETDLLLIEFVDDKGKPVRLHVGANNLRDAITESFKALKLLHPKGLKPPV